MHRNFVTNKSRQTGGKLRGFTLIELSISLVIIGLIVGGILGARDLLRQAELRSVMTEVNNYKTAFNVFQLKYNALPGDMINASDYWTTTDGDGNQSIDTLAEAKFVWNHLALAGIIPGSYSGTGSMIPGTNMPASDLEPGGWWPLTLVDPHYGRTGRLFILGSPAAGIMNAAAINPPDAKAIDLKMDDGLADSGNVHTHNARDAAGTTWLTGCTTAVYTAASATYMPQNTDLLCRMFFWMD